MADDVVNLIDTDPPERYRFDYKGMHRYFIKLPVYASKQVFIERGNVDRVLNSLRDSALRHRFDVYAYCFLPGELVLIVRGKEEDSMMKEFLTDFRLQSTAALEGVLGHPLWKRKYLERVLRKKEETRLTADAIFQLPVKAGLVKAQSDYAFQGSFVVVRDSPGSLKYRSKKAFTRPRRDIEKRK